MLSKKLPPPDQPLTKEQQASYLNYFLQGWAHIDILYKLGVKPEVYTLTCKTDKAFIKAKRNIRKGRKGQVEASLINYATGKAKIVKKVYVPKVDEELNPVVVDGKQQFTCTRVEVTHLPANPNLIQYFLKMLEGKKGDDGMVMTPDTLLEELAKAALKSEPERKAAQ